MQYLIFPSTHTPQHNSVVIHTYTIPDTPKAHGYIEPRLTRTHTIHSPVLPDSPAKFARSPYMEAEQTAAAILPLCVIPPSQWTPSVVRAAVATASIRYLQQSIPGRKALSLCQPYTAGIFQPQYYLIHELKPYSSARARLRLDIALTPAILHRYNPSLSAHCSHCTHPYADSTHLLLHCPAYEEQRQSLCHILRKYTPSPLTSNIALHAYDRSILTLSHKAQQHILLASSALILVVTQDLPNTLSSSSND